LLAQLQTLPLVRQGRLYVFALDRHKDGTNAHRQSQAGLHTVERRLVAAADRYVELLRQALDDPTFRAKYPNRGAKIPEMMYIVGQMLFAHGQYREAVERLRVIFDLYPKHERAHDAVELIIEAYKRLQESPSRIEDWSRSLVPSFRFAG